MELNELLKEELESIVSKQVETGDPPETRETFERLQNAGYSKEEITSMIARVLVVEMHTVVSEGQSVSRSRYAKMLRDLPTLPEEHWD